MDRPGPAHRGADGRGAGRRPSPAPAPPLTPRRRTAGFGLALAGPPIVALAAHALGLALTGNIPLFLAAVVLVALVGGRWPALVAAIGGFLLLNYYFVAPLHTLAIATRSSLVALAVFVVVALAVSWVVDLAARRTRQADRAAAEAHTLATVAGAVLGSSGDPLDALLRQLRDTFGLTSVTLLEQTPEGWRAAASVPPERSGKGGSGEGGSEIRVPADDTTMLVLRGAELGAGDRRVAQAFAAQAAVALEQRRLTVAAEGDRVRTALLAAVGHDLRTPLASAKAAVAGLRSPEVEFGPEDRDELLATADESLDRLAGLVANLLDMSRLQAGALGMMPADVGLEDVAPRALDELGDDGRRVVVRLPDDLPAVRADPGLLDRVLVNLVGNALRYSPDGRPPEISGTAAGDMVELRVVDHGPGIPRDKWEQVFRPFQRLGDRNTHQGVGLGLALARGLAEAMGGSLRPAETSGGGLTMILLLPAAKGSAQS
jgi:two-component system sensor histidine kinase KdpD